MPENVKYNITLYDILRKMKKIRIVTFAVACLLLVASIFPFGLSASFNEYHSSPQPATKTQYITFHWEESLAHGDWNRYCLWDLGSVLGHCYLSFHYSFDTSLDVPATLSATYPSFLEPNQSVLIETKLETTGDRVIEIRPSIYLGIDFSAPWLFKSFKATYGGQWTMTFNLNTKSIKQMLNKVWIGDFTGGQLLSIATDAMNLNSYVTLQRLDINDASLGTLVLGEIKVDLLRAVLHALLNLLSIPPALQKFVDLLDWLVSNVFKVSTGLIVTPTISAFVSCPIQTGSQFVSIEPNLVQFEKDLSPKNIQMSAAAGAEEKSGTNEFHVSFSPISFSYKFDVNWQYYLEINIGFLGLSLIYNNWTYDIYEGPSINWDSQPISTSLEIISRIDEPLQATEPSVNDDKIAMYMIDKSGISEAVVYYSLDKVNWNSQTLIQDSGTLYSQKPISDVSQDTIVFYYVKALDGQGDPYYIGTAGNCYNYTLKASLLSILQSPRNLAILSVIIIFVAAVTGVIVFRKRAKNKMLSLEGR